MKKTKYSSFLSGSLPKGCKLCVRGEKSVIFVTGKCGVGCKFCPLSNTRKNTSRQWINEREIKSKQDLLKEAIESNAKGCSFTGGDPLLEVDRVVEYATFLKKNLSKKFHTHIYLATLLVNDQRLSKLSKVIDEVRFHPNLDKPIEQEVAKIALAKKYWKKSNIGIELPAFPDKIDKIINFIKASSDNISFLNMNELESGEVSEKYMQKKYNLSVDGYTIKDSISAGKYIMKKLSKLTPKINIHLCTANLKNWHQYRNRLKNYKKKPLTKKGEDGMLLYFAIDKDLNIIKDFPKNQYLFDDEKNRIIISEKLARKLRSKINVYRIEEYPTAEREESEVDII